MGSRIEYGTSNDYVTKSGEDVVFFVGGNKALTLESDGGILHGTWNAQNTISTSDRRLKREIKPLQRTLRGIMPVQQSEVQDRQLQAKADAAGSLIDSAGKN